MCHGEISSNEIFERHQSLRLSEGSSGFYSVFEIAAFTKLSDDIAIVDSWKNIETSYNIRMFQLFKCIDFNGKLIFECVIKLFFAQIDDLDGYLFFSELVDALEDIALFSQIDLVAESIGVVLYLFAQLVFLLSIHNNRVII